MPDLITTAKGIAAGMPLSAVTGRADLFDAVHPGGLGGTYSGNPIACAAALAGLDFMESADLRTRAKRIGELAQARLKELAAETDGVIGDVRGRGAMIAIELVDPATGEPATKLDQSGSSGGEFLRCRHRHLWHVRQRHSLAPTTGYSRGPPARRDRGDR